MQDLSMGCEIDFQEDIEGTDPAPLGSVAFNPFDIMALLTSFTTGEIGSLIIAATPSGVVALPTLDIGLIGVVLTFAESLVVPPPLPVLKTVSTVTIGNLLTLTGGFVSQSLGGLIFGLDVSAIISGVSVISKKTLF